MANNPMTGSASAYPRRIVADIGDWENLVNAYSSSKPKRILAEGDSWLAYPQLLGSKNIVLQLADNYQDLILLCLACSGDEAVTMLSSLSGKTPMLEALRQYDFDFLLFSGGGNDIVGEWDFDFFLNEKTDDMDWTQCIRHDRLQRRLAQIQNAYLDLLDYTFTYAKSSSTIKIVTHTYDYPIPESTGVLGGKSWMWPYLMQKKIHDETDQRRIAKFIMDGFAATLSGVEANPVADHRFKIVDTRNLVAAGEWVNEIHPTSAGFRKVTDKIYREGLT